MLAVLLVCATPVYLLHVLRDQTRGSQNFGELIDPQRPMMPLSTSALDGKVGDISALKASGYSYHTSAALGEKCEIFIFRQMQESLGKKSLDRVWLVNDGAAVASSLTNALAETAVLRVDESALSKWLAPAASKDLSSHLYVVDPLEPG
jgi:hypothetical protein